MTNLSFSKHNGDTRCAMSILSWIRMSVVLYASFKKVDDEILTVGKLALFLIHFSDQIEHFIPNEHIFYKISVEQFFYKSTSEARV